jgi:hypothetical protein
MTRLELSDGAIALNWDTLSLHEADKGRVLVKLARKKGTQTPRIADMGGNVIPTRGPANLVQVG